MINLNIDPVAFTIDPIEIRWYGIMVALAVLTVVLWSVREVRRGASISYDTIFTAALVGIPSGIIFSRLLHVIDRWDHYMAYPGQLWGFGGLTIWGAILGATLGIWIYSRFTDFKFGYFVDLLTPAVLLAQVIGRIGCTINGCCYGQATTVPCAVIYTNPDSYAPLGIAVHPTQLYEIIFLLIVFGVLFWLRKRFQPQGSLFLIYLSLYSAWRLGIGFLRDGTDFLFGLHQAQVLGIVVLLIVIPILVVKTRWVKGENKT